MLKILNQFLKILISNTFRFATNTIVFQWIGFQPRNRVSLITFGLMRFIFKPRKEKNSP